MDSNKKIARIAGLFNLVLVVTGIFSLLYVPTKLIVWSDAAATFNNIVNNETLFRLGIVAGIVAYISFLFLPLILYKLLSPINKIVAISMVILAVVSVPISLVNINHKFEVLTLISKATYLNVFQENQLHAQVMLSLERYSNGIESVSIFLGALVVAFRLLGF
jgi:hypothetical protein